MRRIGLGGLGARSYICRKIPGKCSTSTPKQLQTPEKKLREMFHKTTTTATFSGEKTPGNVPKNSHNSYIRRKIPGKCSTSTPKQLQTPEKKLREMFHKTTKTATFAGKFPANVPKNSLKKFA
ncbi:hypothetical protein [Gardnerella vaginalis]|uniref:hypothetical protein n=1 Tax=Gardnerella vaginalis TaxID=2702 RepID=UPI0039EEE9C8